MLVFIKIKNSATWKTPLREKKSQTGKKYLQNTYLTKNLYLNYTKKTLKLKKTTQLKNGQKI